MSYEYRVITENKTSTIDLELIYNNFRGCSCFNNVVLTEYGISVPNENGNGFELVGIELIEEGFFVTANLNRKERGVVLEIIQRTMNDKGIQTIVEEE